MQRIPLGAFSSAANGVSKTGKVTPAINAATIGGKMSPRADALKKKAGGFIKSSNKPVSC